LKFFNEQELEEEKRKIEEEQIAIKPSEEHETLQSNFLFFETLKNDFAKQKKKKKIFLIG